MFSQASVSHSVEGLIGISGPMCFHRGWWVCPGLGMSRGKFMSGGTHALPLPGMGPRDTVDKQAIRILLECFLVLDCGLSE